MTTHRRAWALRAGLTAVLVAGALGVTAAPALAADSLNISVSQLKVFAPGDSQSLEIDITLQTDNPPQGNNVSASLRITGLGSGFTLNGSGGCSADSCQVPLQGGGNRLTGSAQFTVQAPSNVPDGQTVTSRPTATATVQSLLGGSVTDSQSFEAQVRGNAPPQPTQSPTPAAPTTVVSVSGTVKDIGTGDPIADAQVAMQDDANHTYTDKTDSKGKFSFKSTDSNPISPGVLAFVVTKEGYQEKDFSQQADAGRSINITSIVLTSTTPASSTASEAPPSLEAAPSGSVVPIPTQAEAANPSSGGGFSTLLIVLGAILVLAGIGAIAFILWRRRAEGNGEDEGDDLAPQRRGPVPVPASRGAYRGAPNDATQIARGGGYGAADQTMIQREPIGRDPMADAPTMMHRPVADEYADPYGAPDQATQVGGYGADPYGGGGYGSASHSDYDRPGYGQSGGYESGGYESGGYDTGGYDSGSEYDRTQPAFGPPGQRPPADPYAPSTRPFDAYSEPTTYGRPEAPGSGAGYGAAPASGGGYGAAPASGGGYGAAAPPPARGGAYGGSGGGYESGGYQSGGYDSGGYESGGRHDTRRYDAGGNGYDTGGNGYGGRGGDYDGGRHGGGYESGGRHDTRRYDAGGNGGYDDQRGGYGQQPPAGGYRPDDQYQPRGGYEPPEKTRRSLDWLDD